MKYFFRALGPGVITGASDDDPSGIGTYSSVGAKFGFAILWMAFWLKTGARKNEKTWEDALLLAYVIEQGMPMSQIPLMRSICNQSVINSLHTMQERRTHLNQE